MEYTHEDALLEENEFFILRAASKAAGKRISRSDDEWSIALSAFWEACRTYDERKGSFHAYAGVVIRHRMIDYYRYESRRRMEMAVEPSVFTGSAEEGSAALRMEVAHALAQAVPETALTEEINELAETLQRYRIDFFDLPSCCPKARKTRAVCLKASRFVCAARRLLDWLRRTLKLPAAEMETGVPISRKLLDQFRKYIIASVEIQAGDFPGLQEYFVGKGEDADEK